MKMKFGWKKVLVHNKFHQKLMVPKCANEYWKRMSNPIKLVLPYGVERKVNWTKRGENIWLEQGWEKVVELCGLSYEWLLIFDYNGMSRFEVKVYDTTTLRVAYYKEYDVENNKDVDETENDDDDDEFVQKHFKRKKTNAVNGAIGIPVSRFEFKNHMLGQHAWQYQQRLQGSIWRKDRFV
ncbi:B3 domain-containing protein At1g49475-like isoform X2 [Arachis stenosperma]|uniref:B3 domain-containing protein At1g49475-like isoform X2 n=1 Tax=Arachis stenosperma TaxID=217475 RepID=UPI0025AB8EA2|nr:B3 domain-containing protein At1g49475-like isoform X2 [Arachis stenosperma]XP_057754352.1 B3 domain-containing protein At1g49475-like isoform X2 [Arachis stenosperma]XP_057754353.1 B3 domain-containing protein At1g49475-like isoform X2 [Arachis stenosperma]XP_057754354.1 B3 domain-containing protein At1g49475-like isoform X2 [Arachis stenosperma]XP_057754355.1 B3 domain-containing protein At1g49475-like isoform X2 [Arachis stenosperma]